MSRKTYEDDVAVCEKKIRQAPVSAGLSGIVDAVRNRAEALGISPAEVLHDVLKEIEREAG